MCTSNGVPIKKKSEVKDEFITGVRPGGLSLIPILLVSTCPSLLLIT
jgi:hypothetical protein